MENTELNMTTEVEEENTEPIEAETEFDGDVKYNDKASTIGVIIGAAAGVAATAATVIAVVKAKHNKHNKVTFKQKMADFKELRSSWKEQNSEEESEVTESSEANVNEEESTEE